MGDYIAAFDFLTNLLYWAVLISAIFFPILIFNVSDPVIGLTFIAALGSLNNTLDSLPAVLLGYPGAATPVTFLEGHQLAMRGRAAHTLGAIYAVSAIGGIVGAVALLAAMPFLRPIIVRFSFPEIAAMALFGVFMVSALSRGAVIKGAIAGLLGVLFGTVGASIIAGDARFNLGVFYLYDGLPVIPTLLGFFALPELIDLTMRGRPVSPPGAVSVREVLAGVRYGLSRWPMTIRQSIFGVFMGAVPGIRSAVIDWLSYAFGISLSKQKNEFGKGSLEGVLFAESAQNAKEGGQMVPTLAFGVPGGLPQVILLVAMILYGVVPGSGILDINRHLGVTMSIVATLAVGLSMKWLGWPRPPLILGFILGPVIERNLWPSINAFGVGGMLTRPVTIVLLVLSVAAVAYVTWALGRIGAVAGVTEGAAPPPRSRPPPPRAPQCRRRVRGWNGTGTRSSPCSSSP